MEKLFSEIYNRYFGIVNLLLSKKGPITKKLLQDTVQKNGFGESLLFLLPRLSANEWELFEEKDGVYHSRIKGGVKQPLSRLQKRWLKAVLEDPRAGLFLEKEQIKKIKGSLQEVQPLFTYQDFYYFDRFSDGDDYAKESYRQHFRTILGAIRNGQMLRILYQARRGRNTKLLVRPYYLEYSVKNDCYRLLCRRGNQRHTLRVSRMQKVEIGENAADVDGMKRKEKEPEKVTLIVKDERNAMERVMLQFADYRKNTVRLEDNRYRCEIFYDKDDETELLIEILSFGPMLQVIGNEQFIKLVQERLKKQAALTSMA